MQHFLHRLITSRSLFRITVSGYSRRKFSNPIRVDHSGTGSGQWLTQLNIRIKHAALWQSTSSIIEHFTSCRVDHFHTVWSHTPIDGKVWGIFSTAIGLICCHYTTGKKNYFRFEYNLQVRGVLFDKQDPIQEAPPCKVDRTLRVENVDCGTTFPR